MELFIQQILNGLTLGSIYGLVALGLTLVYGILHVPNFAHGALYMLGAFVALIGYSYLGPWLGQPDWHMGFWTALVVSPLLVGGLGMLIERFLLRRLYDFDHIYGLLFQCQGAGQRPAIVANWRLRCGNLWWCG